MGQRDVWLVSAPAVSSQRDDVVSLEAVDEPPEAVLVLLPQLFGGEVRGEVREAAVLRPDFVAGVEEFPCERICVCSVELGRLNANVVEADV